MFAIVIFLFLLTIDDVWEPARSSCAQRSKVQPVCLLPVGENIVFLGCYRNKQVQMWQNVFFS